MSILEKIATLDGLINYLETQSIDEIVTEVAALYNIHPMQLINHNVRIRSADMYSGAYYLVLKDLKSSIDDIKSLYERLDDDKSRETLLNLMRYRLTASITYLNEACDKEFNQYFDKTLVKCNEEEVFVDCGAYVGDTIESFIKNYGKYKKIYSYEPSKENLKKCTDNTKDYNNIEIRNFGVGEKNKVVKFIENGPSSVVVDENVNDENNINVVSIDEDIQEKIDFLKMDVEGQEINALLGAINHIKEDSPKLAICVYHISSDIWKIPKLIASVNQNYYFYLRHYENNVPFESVLYAIPKDNK